MPNLVNIKNLLNRYQVNDPMLFEILTGMYDEIVKGQGSVTSKTTENLSTLKPEEQGSGEWSPIINITQHVAADFTASGGEVWNTAGNTLLERNYKINKSKDLMYYAVDIRGTTIVFGGIGAVMFVKLPNGYKCATAKVQSSATVPDFYYGSGTNVAIVGAGIAYEPAAIYAQSGSDLIRIVRPGGAFYPASTNYQVGFTITLPVQYQGGVGENP